MTALETYRKLTNQLLPTGRAFRMPDGGDFQKLRDGLTVSEARFKDDAMSIIDSTLPDNANFSADDATIWERRYGLISNSDVPLADHKAALIRKINQPGNTKPRQSYRFIQKQLNLANFNLTVHENLGRVSPLVTVGFVNQLGDYQLGDAQLGGAVADKVARSIYADGDASFDIGTNYSNIFFIGGPILGEYANVSADRELELRDLILRVKGTHLIAYLLVNYI